jgi:M6 family metalloprotease-like protein
MFFGTKKSLAHWFLENSQGRYRIVPHPTHPIIGPFQSIQDHRFYWREPPFNPPLPGDPHYWADPKGTAYYLDDQGFISGFTNSYAEAVHAAANVEGVDFGGFDLNKDGELSPDECLILIVKAHNRIDGYHRYHWIKNYEDDVCGSHIPWKPLKVDTTNTWIKWISELYAAPPPESDPTYDSYYTDALAVGIEETLHQAANVADQYTDERSHPPVGLNRRLDDPGVPGQLSLTSSGWLPVHMDPYHKLKWGWLNPQLADRSGRYTLRQAATTGDALILYSPYFGTDEFFILENRWRGNSYDNFRNDRWQEGLALWHCIQDPKLADDWARRAVHLRRADLRLDANKRPQDTLALFDGSDPKRGYDLHDDSFPQNLRFRNGIPSRIRIRNISPSDPTMTVEVEVPPTKGEIISTTGKIQLLRVHEDGGNYGFSNHVLTEDCIVTLDTEPGAAFGVNLVGANAPTGMQIFNQLRVAFEEKRTIRLKYEATNAVGGRVIRIIETH